MASKSPKPEIKIEPSTEEAPPAYSAVTGTLETHQDGLNTETQVGG